MEHIPRASGTTLGVCNNWWQYIVDTDGTLSHCSGDDCLPRYELGEPCVVDKECGSGVCDCDDDSKLVCVTDATGLCN
jgi:hypothetical protein